MSRYETVFGMTSDREAIAGRLIKDEMAARRLTIDRLAIETLTSRATIAKARNGDMSPRTRIAIELALRWHRGFLQAVLDGDVYKIADYPITDDFTRYIRDTAVEQLRRVAMLLPVEDDEEGNEVHGNGN